jgi:hypothetical protein
MTKHFPENVQDIGDGGLERRFFERVAAWLQANGLTYAEYPEGQYFSLRYTGDAGDWRVIIDVSDGNQGPQVLIHSYYPVRVPEIRRPRRCRTTGTHQLWHLVGLLGNGLEGWRSVRSYIDAARGWRLALRRFTDRPRRPGRSWRPGH